MKKLGTTNKGEKLLKILNIVYIVAMLVLMMSSTVFAEDIWSKAKEIMMDAYAEAVKERYRFFSFGDAMFIH